VSKRAPENAGLFYVIRWEPATPDVYKFGWTCDIDRRLYEHRMNRGMPDATVLRSWPCASRWERAALAGLRPFLGARAHGSETFVVSDVRPVMCWLDAFFQDRERGVPAPPVVAEPDGSSFATGPDWMLVSLAADTIGVSRPTLYRMIREGRITAHERTYMKRNRYLVSVVDVQRIVTEEGRSLTGQPPAD
jgi:excisionase family DNA binding protein